jgi:hypothetical protein
MSGSSSWVVRAHRVRLVAALSLIVGCGGKTPALPDAGSDPVDAAPAPDVGADAAVPPDGGGACIPRVLPQGITALDANARILNARGIHLVDWDGFLANPAETITLRPPADIEFPATATLAADHPRLYFDLPSATTESGPRKVVQFDNAQSTVTVRLGIFPDRDGVDEHYHLAMTLDGTYSRVETVAVTVHDQDKNLPLLNRITVDFTKDQTGFFASAAARDVVQQAADDWCYFLDDLHLDPVPAMDELTFIWDPTGFMTGNTTPNATAYTGFLLYAYGIHSAALRSGGEGSLQGKPATSNGAELPLRRSGGVEAETEGNFNTLGWIVDLEPDNWWKSANFGNEQNDFYSIMHHEIGHAYGFSPAYPRAFAARTSGLTSPALVAHHGGPLAIDAFYHFDGIVDRDSGFGMFGNEYHGPMPPRRWLITRTDVLALEALGYKLRALTFDRWQDAVPDCP